MHCLKKKIQLLIGHTGYVGESLTSGELDQLQNVFLSPPVKAKVAPGKLKQVKEDFL